MNQVDRKDVSWMLEMIRNACAANAAGDGNDDWQGIAEAAHMCLHYVGDGCIMLDCTGPDMKSFMRFAGRYSDSHEGTQRQPAGTSVEGRTEVCQQS